MEILASSAQSVRLCNKSCAPHHPVTPPSTAAIIDSSWYREKLEASRRKLAMNYERELLLKRQHTICVLQPHQLPPPEAPSPRRADRKRNMKPVRSGGSATINGAAGTTRGSGCHRPIKAAGALQHSIQKPACRSHSQSPCLQTVRKMSTRGLAMCTATKMRRELLMKLGHDEVQQPLPTSALPAPIPAPAERHLADQEIQSMKINDAVPVPAMVQAPRERSPVAAAESKHCSSLQIIRKSMFKFVIKLGSAAADNGAGQFPTACRH